MNLSKLSLTVLLFIIMTALGCKSIVESPEPVGTWTKTPTETQSESPGILEFKDDSHFIFTAEQEGHSDSKGRYSILDGKITFEDDTCYNPGTYTYMLENSRLTLEIISDSCQQRAVVISGTWSKKNN